METKTELQVEKQGEVITLNEEKIAQEFGFTAAQVAIAKRTVAKTANLVELAFFLNVAKSQDLDPFNKEIWCYKDHKNNLIIFAGRDGMLRKAMRSKDFGGLRSSEVCANDEFEMDIPNGEITHKVTSKTKEGRGAIVGAYAIAFRKGGEPTIEYAHIEDYDKKQMTWNSHKAAMIKKCAEHRALKMAFGFTGLQSEEEFFIKNGVAYPKTLSIQNDYSDLNIKTQEDGNSK